jgi:hypothetical protein
MTDITAVWANNGEDKVTRDELRATQSPNSSTNGVINSKWDGTSDGELDIQLFGARNEVVSFNLILEAAWNKADDVTVSIAPLQHEAGDYTISSRPATGDGVFNWVDRNIELFYVDYLQIEGLSRISYPDYDERLVPERFRRPFEIDPFNRARAIGGTTWEDRPDHDKEYPDIAVPLELVNSFDIAAGKNQAIWTDIYIPIGAPAGTYTTTITVQEEGTTAYILPLELEVKNFTLPNVPTSKTMVALESSELQKRYGTSTLNELSDIIDTHAQLFHRHRISPINTGSDADANVWQQGRPDERWVARLDGSLFTPDEGYAGPGVGIGTGVFSIGTYRDPLAGQSQQQVWQKADEWVNWFNQFEQDTNQGVDYFVYLTDEPGAERFPQIQEWLSFLKSNPGVGRDMQALLTIPITEAQVHFPNLDIPTSTLGVWDRESWQSAFDFFKNQPGTEVYMYNGSRPGSGSFAIEDDGVALRQLPWGQEKMGVDRWFYWASTYYNNYQGGEGETNVFEKAQTFGSYNPDDPNSVSRGKTGWNYSNGDGVLVYPGTDKLFPENSYDVDGPLASLRLKHWRRGIQDIEYVALARKVDPEAVEQIIQDMVPKALWEYGVYEQADPTYQHTDISWSTDPDVWEAARSRLANLIEQGVSAGLIDPTFESPNTHSPPPPPAPEPPPAPDPPLTPGFTFTPGQIPTPGPTFTPGQIPTSGPTFTPISSNQVLRGNNFKNRMKSSDGDDLLIGRGENDFLDSGPGNDVLIGGRGSDRHRGGSGSDTFVFRRRDLRDRPDRILDFEVGNDLIDLQKVFRGQRFNSDNPFTDYVRIGGSSRKTAVQIDWSGNKDFNTFKTLVILKGIEFSSIDANSFIV